MSALPEAPGGQPASYLARFPDGSPHIPDDDDAFVLVRVTEPVRAGVMTVYLPDGTALVVPGADLLRLTPAPITNAVGGPIATRGEGR